jgi:transmembrane sensor
MPDARLKYLFDQYLAKTCTATEKQELAVMILSSQRDEIINDFLQQAWDNTGADDDMPEEKATQIIDTILATPDLTLNPSPKERDLEESVVRKMLPPNQVRGRLWRKLAVAASIILMLGVGSYFLFFNKSGKKDDIVKTTEPAKDVEAPKVTKAMITLIDGRTVALDSVTSGMLAMQGNVKVVKTVDGEIVYSLDPSISSGHEIKYNTLNNPRGSIAIDMTLADGSKVWLNAGSSVTFPVVFVGNERKVSITGEAYFEVAHDITKPFFVTKGNLQVQVLGTHFNINAYDDEDDIKVTLLEGSVKVLRSEVPHSVRNDNDKGVVIKPGEQARAANDIKVMKEVDLEEVMAWKNGRFEFGESTSLDDIMRQVSRWYDVDIEYKENIKQSFGGSISRQVNVSKVLEKFELTGRIHFKIEGRKIVVMK